MTHQTNQTLQTNNDSIKFTIVGNKKSYLTLDVNISEDVSLTPIMYGFRYRDDVAYSLQFSLMGPDSILPRHTHLNNRVNITQTKFICKVSTRNMLKTGWSSRDSISLSLTDSDNSTHILSKIQKCIPAEYKREPHPFMRMKDIQESGPLIITIPRNVIASPIQELAEPTEPTPETQPLPLREKRKTPSQRWPMWLDAPIYYDRKKRYGFDLLSPDQLNLDSNQI